MTVAVFKPCALCGQVTSKRCSACKDVHFCSMSHLQLLWPTHSYLCSARSDLFTLPPLTQDEVAVLDWRTKHAHLVVGKEETSPSGLVRTRQLQLCDGCLQKICLQLSTSPSPIHDPTRTILLLFLRQTIFSTESVVSGPKHKPTVWQTLSHFVYPFFDPTSPALAPDFPDHALPLDAARPFLLKLLSLVVLSSANKLERRREAVEQLVQGAYEELENLGLDAPQQEYASALLEGFRGAVAGKK